MPRIWVTLICLMGFVWGPSALANANDDTALRPVRVQLKWRHQFQFAGYYAAIEQGYYQDAGLDVRLLERTTTHAPIDQLIGGRVDFAVVDTGALIYRSAGVPLVALAAIFQSSPSALMTLDDGSIKSLTDLKNKRVMLSGDYLNAELIAMLANAGVAVDEVELVPSDTSLSSLTEKRVAAYNGYTTNEPYVLEENNIPFKVFHPIEYGVDFYGDILLTTEPFIQSDPQLTHDFLDATRRGWEYAMLHPKAVVELILQEYNTTNKTREHLLYEAQMSKQLILPQVVPIGYMNRERWEHIEGIFRAQGLLSGDTDLDKFIYRIGDDKALRELLLIYRWQLVLGFVLLIGVLLLLHTLRLKSEVATRTRQLSEAKRQAEVEARTDYLTNLPNRRHFLECLTRYLAQAERHNLPLALIMIDIDFFKKVNDRYGHAAGDEALHRVSLLLKRFVRTGDMAARMGGEEFAIACLSTREREAEALAQRLREAAADEPIDFDEQVIRLTFSVGIAVNEKDEDVHSLLRKADVALYRAKAAGRNRVYRYAGEPGNSASGQPDQ